MDTRSARIKAIETSYKGYLFRSRLEARWAVFFDALGLVWEYEREGFELDGLRYLPDFWLSQVSMWAEVKPVAFTSREKELTRKLAELTGHSVLRLVGAPEDHSYDAIEPDGYVLDYCLTNHKSYPEREGRFYCQPAEGEHFEDTAYAAEAARSARFEFGR